MRKKKATSFGQNILAKNEHLYATNIEKKMRQFFFLICLWNSGDSSTRRERERVCVCVCVTECVCLPFVGTMPAGQIMGRLVFKNCPLTSTEIRPILCPFKFRMIKHPSRFPPSAMMQESASNMRSEYLFLIRSLKKDSRFLDRLISFQTVYYYFYASC